MAEGQHYQYKHIAWNQEAKTWLISTIRDKPMVLGCVVVNTGGQFVLTLYNGMGTQTQPMAVIVNPGAGHTFTYECVLDEGIAYSLKGERNQGSNPYSVTITYLEL